MAFIDLFRSNSLVLSQTVLLKVHHTNIHTLFNKLTILYPTPTSSVTSHTLHNNDKREFHLYRYRETRNTYLYNAAFEGATSFSVTIVELYCGSVDFGRDCEKLFEMGCCGYVAEEGDWEVSFMMLK